MRRTALAAAVAVVLALLLWLRLREQGGSGPVLPRNPAPSSRPAPAPPDPAPPPVPGPIPPEAQPEPPAAAAPASRLQLVVKTNVPGAMVKLRRRMRGGEPDPPREVVIVGQDCMATFPLGDNIADCSCFYVEVGARGYVTVYDSAGPGPQVMAVDLRPVKGVALRGTILDADGQPVDFAEVSSPGRGIAESGEDGSFEFWGNEGPAEVAAKAPGYVETRVEVTAPSDEVEIRLSRGLSVSGRVSFPDGRPAAGIAVNAGDEEARTDPSGAYIVHGLRAGTVQVQAEPHPDLREVQAGASGVDFVLPHHVAVVRMVDGQGRPFRWPMYFAQQWKRGEPIPPTRHMPGQAGPSGIVTTVLEDGETLRIAPLGLGYVCPVATIVAEGPPALHEVAIPFVRPARMATLLLRVRDESGVSPPRARIEARNEMGTIVPGVTGGDSVALAPDGTARVEGIVPGKFVVTVVVGQALFDTEVYGLAASRELFFESGQTTAGEFVVGTGGRVTVVLSRAGEDAPVPDDLRLRDDRGEPVEMAFGILKQGKSFSRFHAAASPIVSDRALPAGRYTVEALREGKVVGSAMVSVVPREMARAEIRLGE